MKKTKVCALVAIGMGIGAWQPAFSTDSTDLKNAGGEEKRRVHKTLPTPWVENVGLPKDKGTQPKKDEFLLVGDFHLGFAALPRVKK